MQGDGTIVTSASTPKRSTRCSKRSLSSSRSVAGHLADKEALFLTVLGACAPGSGVILEIGSFLGNSTIILAKAAAANGQPALVAIDPLSLAGMRKTSLDAESGRDEFFANLERAGARDRVEFHEMLSEDVASEWDRPIRLLWIDGDHTFEGATADFVNFSPHLIQGGVIAFHDVMHSCGVTRVFIDRVLRSGMFGAAGIVGSIGRAQLTGDGDDVHRGHRDRLARRLDRWVRTAEAGCFHSRTNRFLRKLLRAGVPHRSLSTRKFLDTVERHVPQVA